jgi:hypothetical protein
MIGLDTGNVLVVLLIIMIFFTLFNIEPFHGGHLLMPTPIDLGLGVAIIAISIIVILFILLRRKIHTYPF